MALQLPAFACTRLTRARPPSTKFGCVVRARSSQALRASYPVCLVCDLRSVAANASRSRPRCGADDSTHRAAASLAPQRPQIRSLSPSIRAARAANRAETDRASSLRCVRNPIAFRASQLAHILHSTLCVCSLQCIGHPRLYLACLCVSCRLSASMPPVAFTVWPACCLSSRCLSVSTPVLIRCGIAHSTR